MLSQAHPKHTAGSFLAGYGMCGACCYSQPGQPYLDAVVGLGTDANCYLVTFSTYDLPNTKARLDFTRTAPHATVRLLAASAHSLCELVWITPDEQVLGAQLFELASAAGAKVARIYATEILVHDNFGVTKVPFEDAVEIAASAAEDEELNQAMCDISAFQALQIVTDVYFGLRPGQVVKECATAIRCPQTIGQCFTVGANRLGLTLMYVGAKTTVVVVARYSATTTAAVKAELAAIAAS